MNKVEHKIPISVVLIALNEQTNIERALRSVAWADDIVVYDSGSTDKTIEIAKSMGARVIQGDWKGFGPTKHAATLMAKYDWVLSIDCDEEVSEELKNEIKSKISTLKSEVVYRLPRLSFYLNRWIKYGGWYPDYQARLFNRQVHNWNQADIHEKVQAQYCENMSSCLNHYVFKSINQHIQTNNRYSGLQAQQMFKDGRKFSWFHFFTKPPFKFFECYFLKVGFLDGWAGYVIAISASYSVFLKWSKLKELEMENAK